MIKKTFFENFELLADAPNGVQKLRELILNMAIQGKLLPQNLDDKSVYVLLEEIKSEKNQLIQKRKLKLRKISESDDIKILKYKIPSNWCWFILPEVVFFQEGPGIRNWQFKSHGIKLLNVQNILPNSKVFFENSDKYVSEEEVNEKYAHFLIEDGDLLFAASGGSWGKSAWFNNPGYKIMLNTSTIRLRFFSDEFEQNYLKYFLDSSYFKKQMELQLVGMQPNFGSTHLSRVYIPIPPLEEQKRIVNKVYQLMALCDELEACQQKKHEQRIHLNNAALDKLLTALTPDEFAQHWQRICDNFDLLYDVPETVGQLRQAILQLAVQGSWWRRMRGMSRRLCCWERLKMKKSK
jgi:type I restriction enzyme S subunit